MKKIGIIGVGNMGSAIGLTLAKANYDLIIYNRSREKLEKFKDFNNVEIAPDNKYLTENSDILILGVKPNMISGVLEDIRAYIKDETIIISIATGVTLKTMEEIIGNKKIVRTMPNTGALIGESMTAITPNSQLNDHDIKEVEKIVSSFGKVAIIEEDLIDAFAGVAGCMPAYVYMFIEAAADGAVFKGIRRSDSYKYIAQTMLGAAKMILETEKHPGELKDMVTSPGGSTIVGVKALEDLGFRSAVINAVVDSIDKNREMGE